jgi:hypothetical protein
LSPETITWTTFAQATREAVIIVVDKSNRLADWLETFLEGAIAARQTRPENTVFRTCHFDRNRNPVAAIASRRRRSASPEKT